jgi:hypothetical protein
MGCHGSLVYFPTSLSASSTAHFIHFDAYDSSAGIKSSFCDRTTVSEANNDGFLFLPSFALLLDFAPLDQT